MPASEGLTDEKRKVLLERAMNSRTKLQAHMTTALQPGRNMSTNKAAQLLTSDRADCNYGSGIKAPTSPPRSSCPHVGHAKVNQCQSDNQDCTGSMQVACTHAARVNRLVRSAQCANHTSLTRRAMICKQTQCTNPPRNGMAVSR